MILASGADFEVSLDGHAVLRFHSGSDQRAVEIALPLWLADWILAKLMEVQKLVPDRRLLLRTWADYEAAARELVKQQGGGAGGAAPGPDPLAVIGWRAH